MRQISRFRFALLASCLSVGLTTNIQAQSNTKNTQPNTKSAQSNTKNTQRPAQPASNGRQTPPAGQSKDAPVSKAPPTKNAANEAEAPPLLTAAEIREQEEAAAKRNMTPELEEILDRWEEESSKIKTLRGEQTRSEFNTVYCVETVTKGQFYLEMPDKGRIDFKTVEFGKKDVSTRRNKEDDKPYSLASGTAAKWICNGGSILVINDDQNTYQVEDIPEDQQGKNIVNTPLPFLFGMKAADAKRRYILKLVNENKDFAIILVKPRSDQDKQNYSAARITLSKKTYLPTKVELKDITGLEIVYNFEAVKMNERKWLPDWGKDPYKPSLKGYTKVVPNSDPAEVAPASGRTSIAREQKEQTAPTMPVKRPVQSAKGPSSTQKK